MDFPLTTITSLLSLLLIFFYSSRVGGVRRKQKIKIGSKKKNKKKGNEGATEEFNNANRIHYNTIENIIIFLPALWLFTMTVKSDFYSSVLGFIWIVGRVLYGLGFPNKRAFGFVLSLLVNMILIFFTIYKCLNFFQ
jgi:glutathione S-transferase